MPETAAPDVAVPVGDDTRLENLGYKPQLNVVVPTGLSSGRGLFNLDWITLSVMVVIAVVGGLYFLIARPDRKLSEHVHDTLEPTGAERHD